MRNWIQPSLVVDWLRRNASGSIILSSILTAARRFVIDAAAFSGSTSASSVVMTRWVSRIRPLDPRGMEMVADGSTLLRGTDRFFGVSTRAWLESATKGWLGASLDLLPTLDASRIRLVGWLVLSAAMTRILLTGIDALAGQSTSGFGWVAVVPFALACVCRPESVVIAWKRSRSRRRALYPNTP